MKKEFVLFVTLFCNFMVKCLFHSFAHSDAKIKGVYPSAWDSYLKCPDLLIFNFNHLFLNSWKYENCCLRIHLKRGTSTCRTSNSENLYQISQKNLLWCIKKLLNNRLKIWFFCWLQNSFNSLSKRLLLAINIDLFKFT